MSRRDGKPLDEQSVLDLARQNMAVSAIARHLCVALPRVNRILREHGVDPAGVQHPPARKPALPPEPSPRVPREKPNPLKTAEATFGHRLKERGGAFVLDGIPIRYGDLVRKVNEQHVAWGMPQPLTACPEWLVAENG